MNQSITGFQFFTLLVAAPLTITVFGCTVSNQGGDNTDGVRVARELEEADIVKLDNGFLYVANPFTGLRVIDVRNIDAPALAGNVELGGRAIELIVRDNLAYIVTSADFFDCAGEPVGFSSRQFSAEITPDFQGSRLWIVDVSDPDAPTIVSQLDINGFVRQARRIDDILYLTGILTFGDVDFGFDPGAFIDSISIADPTQPAFVDSETFDGDQLDIAATPNRMVVMQPDPTLQDTSLVTYVDIRDPEGQIEVRDQFRVPGIIANRFFTHFVDNTLFIVTSEFVEDIQRHLISVFAYDVSNPDDIDRLAQVSIDARSFLHTARFEGNRAYIATTSGNRPVYVVDLSDPQNPTIAAELDSPGSRPLLFPSGDRLLAVSTFQPLAALYDVSVPENATRLSQILLNGPDNTTGFTTVNVAGLRIVDDGRLALVPMSFFDDSENQSVEAMGLLTIGVALTQRGMVNHRGLAERADILDNRLWLLSDLSFQTVNIDDPDNPISIARLDDVGPSEQDLLDGGFTECVDSARDNAVTLFVGAPCGVLGFVPFMAMFVGLFLLKARLTR